MAVQLNDKWIKASVLGTIWASSEIVLGSFLHNLRIPFSGNILTAIGIVILISASYKWEERGLFWRAGVICALLKTMSPSAVIFGPMVAIFSEAVLLEVSTRLLGRTIPGFIAGAALAMSWNLFQRIFNFIIYYGQNIVEVYTNIMQYAERQLGLRFDAVWLPLIVLLVIYALFGVFSALIGIRTGRKIQQNGIPDSLIKGNKYRTPVKTKKRDFNYSMYWLVLNLFMVTGTLILIERINFFIWILLVTGITITWALRYKRALRQLIKPGLWIFFIVITMLTAFVFSRIQSDSKTLFDAVLIGIEMNLRAIILIMGFTVLGTELYNPKIRNYLARSYFKQLPLALELSIESLPMIIANTPDFKTIIKNPFLFIQQIMYFADNRLNEIKSKSALRIKVFVVTGGVETGKTSCLKKLILNLKEKNISVSGFYSQRRMSNSETTGYDIIDVSTGLKTRFLRIEGIQSQEKIGKYFIYNEGIKAAENALIHRNSSLVVLDEIGKLELKGKGFTHLLQNCLSEKTGPLLLSVREEILNELIEEFDLKPIEILNVTKTGCEQITGKIEKYLMENCQSFPRNR